MSDIQQEQKQRDLNEILIERANASHRSNSTVKTGDDMLLYQKSKDELSAKGTVEEQGTKTIHHLACGCEYRGQPTIRTAENPELIYCERCFARCFRCKKPMMISKTHPLAGHLYCRFHYYLQLLKILVSGLGKAILRIISWVGRNG